MMVDSQIDVELVLERLGQVNVANQIAVGIALDRISPGEGSPGVPTEPP